MTTLPPDGMIYGVQADTLAAYVEAERAKVWETVLNDLDALGLLHHQVTMSDEMRVFVRRCREQAAKETP